jgi:hypothetical protein
MDGRLVIPECLNISNSSNQILNHTQTSKEIPGNTFKREDGRDGMGGRGNGSFTFRN